MPNNLLFRNETMKPGQEISTDDVKDVERGGSCRSGWGINPSSIVRDCQVWAATFRRVVILGRMEGKRIG